MNIYNLYSVIGPWVTPAPAAIALAARLYGQQDNPISAWAIAIFSLLALEIVGGLCTEDMMHSSLKGEWNWFKVSAIGVAAYAALGVYALWGITAWIYVILAIFVHVAVTRKNLRRQVRQVEVEDRSVNLQELTFKTETELKLKELQLKMEREKTKQIKAEKMPARASTVPALPAVTLHKCQHCPAEFSTVQALNAHKRFCKGTENV